jgi:hypothetical protein
MHIRFAMLIAMAHLVVDSSPVQVAGMLLQFLMLNPTAGVVKPKLKKEDAVVVAK